VTRNRVAVTISIPPRLAEAEADLIVTGDSHLLKLRRFGTTGIVKVSTFPHALG